MNLHNMFEVAVVGRVHSSLVDRASAPLQGSEGAPDAKIEIEPAFSKGLEGIEVGQHIWVLTWLHQSERSTLFLHPRGDAHQPMKGVFATRSPARPNPIGLHWVTVLRSDGRQWLEVRGLEAIDGTPVIDIKPVIENMGGF
jgi:tRNA-Thr(GGU) m(6)t(6)A37 methyltransferase TsaA